MKGVFISSRISLMRRWISIVVILAFMASPGTAFAQTTLALPAPGARVEASAPVYPVLLRGIKVHPEDPLLFDFLVARGDQKVTGDAYVREIEKIGKYFFAALTIPEKELWVNLSPYEQDRVMEDSLAHTLMGQELLAQDYMLKQLAATMSDPDKGLGRKFWDRVYEQAAAKFGTTDIPVDTFSKVWVLADNATVLEKNGVAYIKEAHLKVMSEQDYLALKKNAVSASDASELSAQVLKEIIVPEIEREVNSGATFASLRQVFYSFILASWYKKALKGSILARAYADLGKTNGVENEVPQAREKIYDQYLQAYRKGVYHFIREDNSAGETIPRKYFSGGVIVSARNVTTRPVDNGDLAAFSDLDLDIARVSGNVLRKDSAEKTSEGQSGDGWWTEDGLLVNELSSVQKTNMAYLKIDPRFISLASFDRQEEMDEAIPKAEGFLTGMKAEYETGKKIEVFEVESGQLPLGFALDRKKGALYISKDFKAPSQAFFIRKAIALMALPQTDPITNEVIKDAEKYGRELEYEYEWSRNQSGVLERYRKPTAEIKGILKRLNKDLLLLKDLDEKELVELVSQIMGQEAGARHESDIPEQATRAIFKKAEEVLYIIGVNILDGITDNQKSMNAARDGVLDLKVNAVQLSSKFNPITVAHLVVTIVATYALTGVDTMYVNVSMTDPRKKGLEKSYYERLDLARAEIDGILGGLVEILATEDKLNQADVERAGLNWGVDIVHDLVGNDWAVPVSLSQVRLTEQFEKDKEKIRDEILGEDKFLRLMAVLEKDPLNEWNGEEVLNELINETSNVFGVRIYTYGQDHDFILKPFFYQILDRKKKLINRPAPFVQFDQMVGKIKDQPFDVTKYYLYWAQQHWQSYREMILLAQEMGTYKIFVDETSPEFRALPEKVQKTYKQEEAARREFYRVVKDGTFEDLVKFVSQRKIMPQLDVDGKELVTGRIAPKKIKTMLARTLRKEDEFPDALRDYYIRRGDLRILNIQGVDQPVAATLGRESLVEALYARKDHKGNWRRVFNLDKAYVHTESLHRKIFERDPNTRSQELLRFLISQQDGTVTPKVMDVMMLSDEEHSLLILTSENRLEVELRKIPGLEKVVVDYREGRYEYVLKDGKRKYVPGETQVRLVREEQREGEQSPRPRTIATLNYAVNNILDDHGNPTVELLVKKRRDEVEMSPALKAIVEEARKLNTVHLVKKLDGIKKVVIVAPTIKYEDAAQAGSAAASAIRGGIEFNSTSFDLNVLRESEGVEFGVDPAELQELESADFHGLRPEVLDIAPLLSLPALFGSNG